MLCTEPIGFIGLLLLLLAPRPSESAADKAPVNQKEFKSLCLFYRLAEAAAHEGKSNAGGEGDSEVNEVYSNLRQLTAINEFLSSNTTTGELLVDFSRTKLEINHMARSNAVKDRIEALSSELEKVLKNLNESEKSINQLNQDARDEVRTARFGVLGEDKGTAGTANSPGIYTASTNRQTTCKGDDNPTCDSVANLRGGCSIVHDMICLCLPGQSGSAVADDFNICGVKLGTVSTWYTSTMTGGVNLTTDWGKLREHCERTQRGIEFNATTISRAIEQFEMLLGNGITTAATLSANVENYQWVLGKTAATTGHACDGANSAGGACVDYGAQTSGRKKIIWLEKFQTALEKLKAADRAKGNLQKLLAQAGRIEVVLQTILIQLSLESAARSRQAKYTQETTQGLSPTTKHEAAMAQMGATETAYINPNWSILALISL